MASGQSVAILDPLRRLIGRQGGCALTDAELLENFVARRDAASFEVLVWRHGAMVLALCNRVLRDAHEAEDAFQATFLVFARKATSIGRGEAVGCWLYKVAYRVALRLRAAAARRPAGGEATDDLLAPEPTDDAEWRDLRPVLDDEISRLPEKYRAAFVLCYLEGRTNEEAAAQLGCPKGTILSRLSRGREWLRSRLARRGVALSATGLALTLSRNAASAASAALPAALARSTTGAAVPFAAGTAAAELVSAPVAALTHGVLHVMTMTSVKTAAAALLALAVVGTGIGWAASAADRPDRTDQRAPAVVNAPAPAPAPAPATEGAPAAQDRGTQPLRGGERPFTVGKVVEVAKDGKSFTMEVPPQARGEERSKVTVKIGEKTAVAYNGVGMNGAGPTAGYGAAVRFEEGSKELAAGVVFTGPEAARRGPDIAGTVTAVHKDNTGTRITIAQRPRERGAEAETVTVAFDAKTVLAFSNVAAGEAKITAGQTAQVRYADDVRVAGNRIAGKVHFIGHADPGRRDVKQPDAVGKVVAVADGGKAITVEVPSVVRGEEPTRTEVKIGDKTTVVYYNVVADGAKLAEGMEAQVWLSDTVKGTAAKLYLTGTVPERWTTLNGKVVAVAKDGSSFTMEQPPAARGEEPTRTEIKLTAQTKVAFFGVGPGEAKPAEGLQAQVQLLDGSKDTAANVTFSKPGDRGRRE
jgi:RNA polymerase sigma factor (sigma-70 family)